jgi:hypothetical protein
MKEQHAGVSHIARHNGTPGAELGDDLLIVCCSIGMSTFWTPNKPVVSGTGRLLPLRRTSISGAAALPTHP